MLIDINWNTNHIKDKALTKFDTTGGSLRVEFTYGNKSYTHTVARRIHQGIYYSIGLNNSINMYSDYKCVNTPHEQRAEFEQLVACKDEVLHQQLRDKWLHRPPEYACADNLYQVLHRGRKFIQEDYPYVLGLTWHNIEKDAKYVHKNGGYVGKLKDAKEVLHYSYIKVRER